MISITLKWQPLSTQHIYLQKGRMRFMKKEAKELKENYIRQIKQQIPEWFEIYKDTVMVEIFLYFGDKRKRDRDNYHKLSMDSMNWLVFIDDNQITYAVVQKHYDKLNPRIEIRIIN